MFNGWNQWSKLRRFGESHQSLVAAQIEFSDNVYTGEKPFENKRSLNPVIF